MGVDPRWAARLLAAGATETRVNTSALVATVATRVPVAHAAEVVAGMGDKEFTATVLEQASLCGWKTAHFLATRSVREDGSVYWRTAVQGDGAGFPDLELVRPPRLIKAELKTGKGRLEPDQRAWRDLYLAIGPPVEWYEWRPEDWVQIVEVLK